MGSHGREFIGERRFPIQPLVAASGAESLNGLIEMLGIESRNFYAATHRATELSMRLADRYACRVGLHPANVWDDWWDACREADMWRQVQRDIYNAKNRGRYHASKTKRER